MNSKKRNTAVVFSVTSDLIFAVASVIMDLKRICPIFPDDIIVFHNGISRRDLASINKIFPIKAIRYKFPIRRKHAFNQDTFSYFSEMVFAKFECLNLLDYYEKVLFLDYDQVIVDNIQPLFDRPLSGTKMLESTGTLKDQLHSPIPGCNMEQKAYCASVMLFSENIGDYKAMYKWCYEKTEEFAKYLYAPEQAIFAMLFEKFNIYPETISEKEYCCHPSDTVNSKNAKILHAYGQPKFWNGLQNNQWNKNYELWLHTGGTPYNPKNMKKVLRIKAIRIKAFLSKILCRNK